MKTFWLVGFVAMCICCGIFFRDPGVAAADAFEGVNGKLVYTSSNQIYSMNADGSDKTDLSNDIYNDSEPAWSPDGNQIVYVSDESGQDQIYTMNADGSDSARITNDSANDSEPAWSPDGNQIVYVSDESGQDQIYTMNADGSDSARITNDSANDSEPAWSPDGNQIAFESDASGSDQIYVMDSDGTDLSELITNAASDIDPRWSTNAANIIFSSNISGNYQIYSVNTDGSNLERLTSDAYNDILPSYSPDLTAITFTQVDGTSEIYTMAANGSNTTALTTTAANSGSDWQSLKLPISLTTPSAPIPAAENLPMNPVTIDVTTLLDAVAFNPRLLPSGITYTLTQTGISFSGTPLGPPGVVNVPIIFYNSYSNAAVTISFDIYQPATIVTTSLPNAAVGTNYDQRINIDNGDGTPIFSVANGALPPGLVLGQTNGIISGIPTVGGTYVFSIQLSAANSTLQALSIHVSTLASAALLASSSSNDAQPISTWATSGTASPPNVMNQSPSPTSLPSPNSGATSLQKSLTGTFVYRMTGVKTVWWKQHFVQISAGSLLTLMALLYGWRNRRIRARLRKLPPA